MVRLDDRPHAHQPIKTGTLKVKRLRLLEELASGYFGTPIGLNMVAHSPGVVYAHQSTHCTDPCGSKVTPVVAVDGHRRANTMNQ